MNITKLPPTHKPVQRFNAIPDSSRDFMFSTPKYNIEAAYASSNFYAPEFYRIKAMDKSGNVIWSGGDKLYVDSFFGEEFISDSFHKMILTQVNNTGNSSSCQIILIDLLTGTEQNLTEQGPYSRCGHLQSFNAVYYDNQYIDLEKGKQFALSPMLQLHYADFKMWWPCLVPYCILVVTNNNIISLFNVREERIVQQTPLLLQTADNTNLSFVILNAENSLQISASHAKRNESGALIHSHIEWFKVEF